jgi:3-deoxy-manno-octulosonate cytidylyltransferase (CMP-KDO synthetase)
MANGTLHIVAIVPARYASTRLPAKPLVDLCGKPMIQRVVEQARKATLIDDVIVATDDERIEKVVTAFGGKAVMTPAAIATGSDRIAYAAQHLQDADIIVNIQGDEPLVDPRAIDAAVQPMVENQDIQVATLVKNIVSAEELMSPHVVKAVLDNDGYAVYFSRSPIPYLRNGIEMNRWHTHHSYYKHFGLYVFRRDFLLKFASWKESSLERIEKLEQLRIIEHGYKIKATITNLDSIPIDTAEDAERVRAVLTKQQSIGAQ